MRTQFFIVIQVPTHFHRNIFIVGGVASDKLQVIPEPIDTDFFNPEIDPLPLQNADQLDFKFLSVFKVCLYYIFLT